jgi:hypothetical protein
MGDVRKGQVVERRPVSHGRELKKSMTNTENIQPPGTPPVALQRASSATVRVQLTMRILEYHTFEREVNKADFERARKHGDVMHWLDEQFRDDPMPDSDINTESCELDAWELLNH